MKIKILYLCFILKMLSGCVSAPKELVSEINSKPDAAVFKNESLALRDFKQFEHIEDRKAILDFNKYDPLLILNGRRAPFKVLEFTHDGGKYFTVFSVIKSAGWKKDAFVLPKLSFYKGETLVASPKVKQIGIDGLCGLDSCFVTVYDLSAIQIGNYRVVMSAYVDNPEEPLEMRKVSGFYYAGTLPLSMTATRAQYASYYGTVKLELSDKLPLNPNAKDVQNF